ncbi:hypothetical protein [Dyella koreensis]
MRRSRMYLVVALSLCMPAGLLGAVEAPAFDPAQARRWFDEAHQQCAADHGVLWGKSLCGPMMFVEPSTRRLMTNQADAQGLLKPEHGVFTGRLPDDVPFANSSVTWAGVHWVQLNWPAPDDGGQRRAVMAHESFHRIQDDLGLAPAPEGSNAHLDTMQGRYLMQLEWRALSAALAATDDKLRRQHAEDALVFRAVRYQHFAGAAQSERALERNEGLAEYTGIAVGATTPAERLSLTQNDLVSHVSAPSFVRSFAYATGPAYGLLLDRYAPAWRKAIRAHEVGLSELLVGALGFKAGAVTDAQAEQRAAAYDGAALLAAEQSREQQHQQQVAKYKAALVDGALLVLPLNKPQVMFNPSTLVPLGDAGTVYPTMRVLSDWGSIEVREGALLSADWKHLTVAAPGKNAAKQGTIEGAGWTLHLAEGWQLDQGARPGDMTLNLIHQGAH